MMLFTSRVTDAFNGFGTAPSSALVNAALFTSSLARAPGLGSPPWLLPSRARNKVRMCSPGDSTTERIEGVTVDNDLPGNSTISDDAMIYHTCKWLETFVIRHQVCPFVDRKHTRIVVCWGSVQEAQAFVEEELRLLDAVDLEKPATTLVVMPEWGSYEHLRMFSDMVNFKEFNYSDRIHAIPFHPHASFDEDQMTSRWDAHAFVMRSPYPTVHLLRSNDVVVASDRWAKCHPHEFEDGWAASWGIKCRNKEYLRNLGWKKAHETLAMSMEP